MKREYIDLFGLDSLPKLSEACLNGCDVFLTINESLLEDRVELEEKFTIKIRTPKEFLRDEKNV